VELPLNEKTWLLDAAPQREAEVILEGIPEQCRKYVGKLLKAVLIPFLYLA
jgi:hypothetical protein